MGLDDLMGVWDGLAAVQAVARAWRDPGNPKKFGTWHPFARRQVAELMPLLARALDRLLEEMADELPSTDPDLWAELPALATVACADVDCRCGHPHARHSAGGSRCRARDCGCQRYRCACAGQRACVTPDR